MLSFDESREKCRQHLTGSVRIREGRCGVSDCRHESAVWPGVAPKETASGQLDSYPHENSTSKCRYRLHLIQSTVNRQSYSARHANR